MAPSVAVDMVAKVLEPDVTQWQVSIVMPSRNEAKNLVKLLPQLREAMPKAELIVVDDASTDNTAAVLKQHEVRHVRRPYRMGNGAAIKAGARAAKGDLIVFMDADYQHAPEDIGKLISKFAEGYEMVVGARDPRTQATNARRVANAVYNKLASWMVGHRVADLTSGFRVVRATKFREFLHLLPNGFSYPTTITMAFFRAGYSVAYVPIRARERTGTSHISPLKDGLRFFLIMFRVSSLYSPLKLFFPASVILFLSGFGNYLYTFTTVGRFTNMSAMLIITSILVFLIGLMSEQITMLLYQKK